MTRRRGRSLPREKVFFFGRTILAGEDLGKVAVASRAGQPSS